ncbi:hypothetical protein [Acetonema longum]|uniref:Uncharacterized protein n=1 Tax=Acetonema longum DSM 6540 TaxID=1009370 RepID=F7NMV0_9FIRM|nr:hypothetical protein [Acetonema longum]EGO62644.1 hypothetical protein ALO_17156 [Acetonema longum DSM 6540]
MTDVFRLLLDRKEFFSHLFIDHLRISLTAGAIAVTLGLLAGILISEYRRIAKLTLGLEHRKAPPPIPLLKYRIFSLILRISIHKSDGTLS